MLKVERDKVYNFEGAIRGMRNPLNSWDKSDSDFSCDPPKLGPKDLDLALRLVKSGSDHRKFLRQIMVSCNITAPLYWWKQFDTYKVGTVANSTSTMHTLTKRKLTVDDFAWDGNLTSYRADTIEHLNLLMALYKRTGEKGYWRELIQDLPSSFLQMRTVTLNYEVLRNIYHARKAHKLTEWHDFCAWIETLPYSEFIVTKEE